MLLGRKAFISLVMHTIFFLLNQEIYAYLFTVIIDEITLKIILNSKNAYQIDKNTDIDTHIYKSMLSGNNSKHRFT